jgi:hypothetical protein
LMTWTTASVMLHLYLISIKNDPQLFWNLPSQFLTSIDRPGLLKLSILYIIQYVKDKVLLITYIIWPSHFCTYSQYRYFGPPCKPLEHNNEFSGTKK